MRVRDWLTSLSLLAAVAFSVLAVGGVLRWTQAVVAILAAVAVGSLVPSPRRFARVSPLTAMLGIALAFTVLQLVPLPASLTGALSPTIDALRTDGSELLGVSPWHSLSADPASTAAAAVMLLTLLAIAVAALRLATSDRGRYQIAAAVALLCGVVAAIVGLHKLLGLHALYGFYEPEYARPILLGPLLNSNSLACLTAMGAVLAIGLAAHRRQPGWLRVLWLIDVAGCGAVTVGTVSRGATLAMLGGALACVAILVAQRLVGSDRSRRRKARFLSGALPMAILAACLVVLVLYTNASNVERQLSRTSSDEIHDSRSKFVAWRSAATLVEESWLMGVGRGGFEPAFTRVQPASGVAADAYVENEYQQAIVDWGIPAAILLALATLWFAYGSARRWRDGATTAGALGALVVVAMHSNVDFGLEFLGLAAPATALAALTSYVPLRETDRPRPFQALRVVHAVLLRLGAGLLVSRCTTSVDDDRRALADGASFPEIRAAVARHPLDYYGYAVAADLLDKAHDPRAIRLLNQALALHPTHPQLHRMAARMLLRVNRPEQASIEYAAALRATPDPHDLIGEIATRIPESLIATALPIDYGKPRLIIDVLLERKRPDLARQWLARVLEIAPQAARACELLFEIALKGDFQAADLAGGRCAERLPDYQTRFALARQLVRNAHEAEAIRLLSDVETWQLRRDEKIDAWFLLCDSHQALGFADEARRCLRRLDASPDMLPDRRSQLLLRLEGIRARMKGSPVPGPAPSPLPVAPSP
jgi:tetratricopeptide (TPR) repeat protein